MQAEAPGVDLFAQQAPAGGSPAAAPDLLYSTIVLRVDTGKLYRTDGLLWCRRQYVADRVLQLDSLTVADALKTQYDDAKGVKKRYK